MKKIKLLDAQLRWVYRCGGCGEMIRIGHDFLDYFFTRKPRKLDKCHQCNAKSTRFELIVRESFIVDSSEEVNKL